MYEEYLRRLKRSFITPDGGIDEKGIVYFRRRDGETDNQFRVRILEVIK